jgi:hypothetical protein
MAGKPPRPPQGWADTEPRSGQGTGATSVEGKDVKGSIGGPASQH